MKIITKVVIDLLDDSILEEESYEYDGPLALCDFGGGGGGGAEAGNIMAAAAAEAAKMQMDMYNKTREDMTPYRDVGSRTTPYYAGMLGVPGYDQVDPTEALRATPGYNWMLNQGTEALNRKAAASGMLGSGAQAKGLMQYGQGLADQSYNNYMNRLYNLVGTGQNASAQTGQFGSQAAGQAGNYLMQGAQARAQGVMADAQNSGSGFNDLLGGLGLLGSVAMMPAKTFSNSLMGSFFK
jgi:hypothetical protein